MTVSNYRDRFPGVNPEVRVEESCIYTLSPDWNPVIDVLPGTHNRILVAVGFSGHWWLVHEWNKIE